MIEVIDATEQPARARAHAQQLLENGLVYSTEFVPFSESRNAANDDPSLNWRITLTHGRASLTTDYMQGYGHIPNLPQTMYWSRKLDQDEALRRTCETGRNHFGKDGKPRNHTSRPLPAPELADVLYSLVSDSDVIEYPTFEDWAENYGYDSDSRQAERTYRACLETALQLRQIIDLDAARDALEDY